MGAGDNPPLEPALAAVELGDESQQAIIGRVDVGGELGNFMILEITSVASHGKPEQSSPDTVPLTPRFHEFLVIECCVNKSGRSEYV
jgi:hypothetical protein